MYACGLFKSKFLYDWEETANKLWGATHLHFTWQFNKERRKLKREKSQKHYEISAVFRETPHLHTLEISQGGATATTIDSSFTAAMDYAAALEEKSNAQSKRIIDLEASMDGQTVLTNTTDYAAIAVATGNNKELSEIKAMMKQLAASVTSQAETVAKLFTKMNGSSSGAGKK